MEKKMSKDIETVEVSRDSDKEATPKLPFEATTLQGFLVGWLVGWKCVPNPQSSQS